MEQRNNKDAIARLFRILYNSKRGVAMNLLAKSVNMRLSELEGIIKALQTKGIVEVHDDLYSTVSLTAKGRRAVEELLRLGELAQAQPQQKADDSPRGWLRAYLCRIAVHGLASVGLLRLLMDYAVEHNHPAEDVEWAARQLHEALFTAGVAIIDAASGSEIPIPQSPTALAAAAARPIVVNALVDCSGMKLVKAS